MRMVYRSTEQASYARLIESALNPGPPLLAGASAGLGKTHGYTIPLVRSGKRVAIALSTRQLIDQYLQSDALRTALNDTKASVCALKPRQNFETRTAYQAHREEALNAQILVVTHAAAIIDSFNSDYARLRERDIVLFDEADLLADAADLHTTVALDPQVLEACGASGKDAQRCAQAVAHQAEEPEERGAARAILHALEQPMPWQEVGFQDDGTLTLKHRQPGRMLRPLLRDVPRCMFTSGTLQVHGRFDYFKSSIGLQEVAPESRHIDPQAHGSLVVEFSNETLELGDQALRIAQAETPVLVLTTSHEATEALAKCLPTATARQRDEPLQAALARCAADGILIAAGAWTGLDDPRLRWRSVVIPKAPFGVPVGLNGQPFTHYIDSEVAAVRRTNQGLHRGLRTPDARCRLILLDPRSAKRSLLSAIPDRFRDAPTAFDEGEARLRTHIERERNAALRNAALKHYGTRCMADGCKITDPCILDVHHKRPISEGQRKTTLDEVEVLCKNHHGLAHEALRQNGS